MLNKQKLPKTFFLVTVTLGFLSFCLPACTDNGQTSTNHPTTVPSTTPTEAITSPINGDVRSYPVPATKTGFAPVAMPPDMTGRITEMLKLIPYELVTYANECYFVDYSAWCHTLGINVDDYRNSQGFTTLDSENLYLNDLILSPIYYSTDTPKRGWTPWLGHPAFISGMGSIRNAYYRDREILKDMPIRTVNIGYGPLDVERSIVSGFIINGEYDNYEAIKGDFGTTAIDNAARTYQDDEHFTIPSIYSGVNIYSWDGEWNMERSQNPPVFDITGQGSTLAVQPHDIFGTKHPAAIDSMVDASLGKLKSLADDPLFQEMAYRMELKGAMSAILDDGFMVPDDPSGLTGEMVLEDEKFFRKAALAAPLLGPYVAYAVGLAVDEQGLFVSVVLLYESPDKAKADIQTLEDRLAKGYNTTSDPWKKEVDSYEIWSDGNTLCAKLYGNVTYYWERFQYYEPLLVRGDGGE